MIYREVDLCKDGTCTLKVYGMEPVLSTSSQRKKVRPAIIVCPGGGYLIRAAREGEPVVARFFGAGYQVFLLEYPTYYRTHPALTAPDEDIAPDVHPPLQLKCLMRAMAYVHGCAGELSIDESRIYALGFSAGAHLAATLAERWDDPQLLEGLDPAETRPRGVVLGYPMTDASAETLTSVFEPGSPAAAAFPRALFGTENPSHQQVEWFDLAANARPDMPRTFIFHAGDDRVVSPIKSAAFAGRLMELGVPCEYHLFETGGHGKSLSDDTVALGASDVDTRQARWVELALSWLERDVKE